LWQWETSVRLFEAGRRVGSGQVVHDRVFTVANGITLVRLVGLPVFVWLMVGPAAYGKALGVLAAVAATDWVDGYVARRFDQVTRLGQLIDPLIDRVLLATMGVTLVVLQIIPWPVIGLIVGRDVLLLMAAALVRELLSIPVNRMGKFATASLFIGIPGFLLGHMDWPGARPFHYGAWGFTAVGIVAYYLAGIQYARAARITLAARGDH
jgi:cardiolipin synthase